MLTPSQFKVHSIVCIGPLSVIIPIPKKAISTLDCLLHFIFYKRKIKKLSFFSEPLFFLKEISIILQQDFHRLRLQIFPEIPSEEALFPLLSVCLCFLIITIIIVLTEMH